MAVVMRRGFNAWSVPEAGCQPVADAAFAYYAGKGFDSARLLIAFASLFDRPGAKPDAAAIEQLRAHVRLARAVGIEPVLTFADFGCVRGAALGEPGFPIRALADGCQKLALAVPGLPIGPMNEPVGHARHGGAMLDPMTVAAAMTAAIAAIRSTGNRRRIHASLGEWCNRASIVRRLGDARNIWDALAGGTVIDLHVYLDAGSAGQGGALDPRLMSDMGAIVAAHRAARREWAVPLLDVGEIAWPAEQNDVAAQVIALIDGAPDVFAGRTYFGADPCREQYPTGPDGALEPYRSKIQPGAEWWDETASAELRAAGPYGGADRAQMKVFMP